MSKEQPKNMEEMLGRGSSRADRYAAMVNRVDAAMRVIEMHRRGALISASVRKSAEKVVADYLAGGANG